MQLSVNETAEASSRVFSSKKTKNIFFCDTFLQCRQPSLKNGGKDSSKQTLDRYLMHSMCSVDSFVAPPLPRRMVEIRIKILGTLQRVVWQFRLHQSDLMLIQPPSRAVGAMYLFRYVASACSKPKLAKPSESRSCRPCPKNGTN